MVIDPKQQVKNYVESVHLAWSCEHFSLQQPGNGMFTHLDIKPDLIPDPYEHEILIEMKSRSKPPQRKDNRNHWFALMTSQIRGYIAATSMGYKHAWEFVHGKVTDFPKKIHEENFPFREKHLISRQVFIVPSDVWQIANNPNLETRPYLNVSVPGLLETYEFETREVDNAVVYVAKDLDDVIKSCFL